MSNFWEETDGYRVKTITQKKQGNDITYPLGADAIYIDMMSGLDLQEQLLFGNCLQITDTYIDRQEDFTEVIEIFQKTDPQDSLNQIQYYKKITRIFKEKIEAYNLIKDLNQADILYDPEDPNDPDDDSYFISKEVINGFGDILVRFFRKENNDWVLIHSKKTIFEIDDNYNIVHVKEKIQDIPEGEWNPLNESSSSSQNSSNLVNSAVVGTAITS